MDKRVETVRKAIKEYPDFPKKGIMFQDIFGVLQDPEANAALNDLALEHIRGCADRIDKIVGLDSRGFLFGNTMALAVNKPFVPIRKKGKLPGKCLSQTYSLEYGEDTLEVELLGLATCQQYTASLVTAWRDVALPGGGELPRAPASEAVRLLDERECRTTTPKPVAKKPVKANQLRMPNVRAGSAGLEARIAWVLVISLFTAAKVF